METETAPGETPRWSELSTEERHPESADLDRLEGEEIASLLLREDRRGLEIAERQTAEIARLARWFAEAYAEGGQILMLGAGTSGRLAVLEAAECPPTFGTAPDRIRGLIAGGRAAVFEAREGAEDRAAEGTAAAGELTGADLLIAISASSVTPFVRGALAQARRRGARTALLTCTSYRPELDDVADLVLALETGPEILTGSTRLKAGSVTKAVLNAVTTAAMVRLGKVFQNLMVDLKPGSFKLRDRAIRIVMAATGRDREESVDLLEQAGGEVKSAVVMGCSGIDAESARRRLEAASGSVRQAIQHAEPAGRSGEAS